jgi:hypothetical protein
VRWGHGLDFGSDSFGPRSILLAFSSEQWKKIKGESLATVWCMKRGY